jgi:uncharacterized membrane protein
MRLLHPWPTLAALGLPLMALLAVTAQKYSATSLVLVGACVVLFLSAWWASTKVLGLRNTRIFAMLGLGLGWFAEQMGSSKGWFFGRYTYTDVLGPRLGDVPLVIPLMWFALCFVGFILANLILWREPTPANKGWLGMALTSWFAAMLVTAFDLGADPYFVFVLKAWVMQKTDGGWFGETLQGFAGWMLISFLIVAIFQSMVRAALTPSARRPMKRAVALPIGIYASGMVYQVLMGHPIETRAVAIFAMGIPVFAAAVAWWQWQKGPS